MKVLVTGGRTYTDREQLFKVLDEIHLEKTITAIIHGGAKGADHLAYLWAHCMKVNCVGVYADWDMYGRAAGPKRNQRMIDEYKPDLVVACPGGDGTADMIRRAKWADIPIRRVVEA